jgi:hypothetical protein
MITHDNNSETLKDRSYLTDSTYHESWENSRNSVVFNAPSDEIKWWGITS